MTKYIRMWPQPPEGAVFKGLRKLPDVISDRPREAIFEYAGALDNYPIPPDLVGRVEGCEERIDTAPMGTYAYFWRLK